MKGRQRGLGENGDDEQGRHQPGEQLGDPVGHHVFRVAFSAQPDGERDGGVKMSARDVPAGEDHDHENRTDRDRGQRGAGTNRCAHGEDEEEGADEFDEVFFHEVEGWANTE